MNVLMGCLYIFFGEIFIQVLAYFSVGFLVFLLLGFRIPTMNPLSDI
jgi:hypothetical protein